MSEEILVLPVSAAFSATASVSLLSLFPTSLQKHPGTTTAFIKNVKARVNKGTGITRKILTLLDGIPFGQSHFEAGVLLRNSLLASSMLFNSEAWYNLSKAELDLLETVDLTLLRGILKAPKSTPKEMLFLELGVLPFREIIRKRRLSFLWYILNEKKDSMIYKFFESQNRNRTHKDWITTVCSDIEELGLNLDFDGIRKMKKDAFMNLVKIKIEAKTLKFMEKSKEGHSKVRNLSHNTLKIQSYLMPSKIKKNKEECQLIFKLRAKVTEVKMNTKGKYENFDCESCKIEDETQEHVLKCEEILKIQNDEEKSIPTYNKISEGTIEEKVIIAKQFNKNMKTIENLRKNTS